MHLLEIHDIRNQRHYKKQQFITEILLKHTNLAAILFCFVLFSSSRFDLFYLLFCFLFWFAFFIYFQNILLIIRYIHY